jgi:8-oxo-dGTP pyrophosphatase MutT (NUDIX family)
LPAARKTGTLLTMGIRRLSTREVYRNPWMVVREDEIERSGGVRGIYGVVEKCDSAIIIPVEDGHFYLIEQFRYPVDEYSLEFPQGSWEQNGINPLEIARGELKEETGLEASSPEYLGEIQIAVGYSNQKTHAYIASGLNQGTSMPDAEEDDLLLHKLEFQDFEQLLRDNRIKDAQTLAAWALFNVLRGQGRKI